MLLPQNNERKQYLMLYFKIIGFIKRDYLIESRYKLNFVLNFVNSILPVV